MKKVLDIPETLCYTDVAVNESGCLEGDLSMNRQPNNNTKITALYERLSRDDELQGPSNSILNQQQMLEDYARRNGFTNIQHYTDDGISGTRFDRPGFVKMMDDIEAGNVGIVLCKDTSRLGRDYLRVGLFMETLRQKGVRLIALGDNVDTDKGEDDFLPFRNIMSEWYARDTSRKIKASVRARGMNGRHTSSHALYGYVKSDTDKNQWVIDPEAADIVRRIFRMTLEGFGPYKIASRLESEKVFCPSYYFAQKGLGNYKSKDFSNPYMCHGSTVVDILSRLEYMGHMVNFKTFKVNFKDKNRQSMPADQQVVFEDKHEAIIDPETWETAQRIRQNTKRRRMTLGEPHILTGLLYCADCGAKLYNERTYTEGKIKGNYICSNNQRHKTNHCTPHRISTEVVYDLVLETLRSISAYARENEAEFVQRVHETFSTQQAGTEKAQRKKLSASQRRHSDLDKLIQRVYEDFVAERISENRFKVLSAEYEQEQTNLTQIISELQAEIHSVEDSSSRAERFLELTSRYTDFTELTAPMLNEFVQQVIVHERAMRWSRWTTQKVEIHLNFIGHFPLPTHESEESQEPDLDQERREKNREYSRDYYRRRRANGGKPLTPEDTRTPEQKAEDEAVRREEMKLYQREYQREWQRDKARKKREAKAAGRAALTEVASSNE